MARKKSTRKPSATQRNPEIVAIVKQLKKSGILSKQTKLHGGKYVSREVAKKAVEFQTAARFGYVAVPVKKEVAQRARDEGFQVVRGNRVIVPQKSEIRKHLKKGELAGVAPVRGGYIESVRLPHDIMDIRRLFDVLDSGEIDKLKNDDEYFAFRFFGNMSYQPFLNSRDLLDYLKKYRDIVAASSNPEDFLETFKALEIIRMRADDADALILSNDERKRRGTIGRKKRYDEYHERRKGAYATRMEKMHPARAKRYLSRKKKESQEYRDSMTPEQKAEYNRKARERSKRSYEKRKKK